MRILIAAAPKTGNTWLQCLLGSIYGLRWLEREERRSVPTDRPLAHADGFRQWVERGGYPDGTIFHQHWRYSPALCDAIEAVPARIVTIVRDPYDAFVSLYWWVQGLPEDDPSRGPDRPHEVLVGKPLDHPDVIAYLDRGLRLALTKSLEWLRSERAVAARYEALHEDPVAELSRITDQLWPVEPTPIESALDACTVDRMRAMSEKLAHHVRKGEVGDSLNHLTDVHLAEFRRHAEQIRGLGYEVR